MGYLSHIAKRDPHNLLDRRPDRVVRRPSAARTIFVAAFLTLAAYAFVSAAAAGAQTAAGGTKVAPKSLVSTRYQASGCDTAAVRAADRPLSPAAFGAPAQLAPRAENHPAAAVSSTGMRLQYQPQKAIPHSSQRHLRSFSSKEQTISHRSCSRTASSISEGTFEPSLPADGRRLLQLAVAFAIAYVVFLTAWFWGTRERRSRVGRAARS